MAVLTTLSVLLPLSFPLITTALPLLPRAAASTPAITSNSIHTQIRDDISRFLATQNVQVDDGVTVYLPSTGFSAVNFENNSNNLNNADVFFQMDNVYSSATNGTVFFSREYINLIQAISNATGMEPISNNSDVEAARSAVTKTCITNRIPVLQAAYTQYAELTGASSTANLSSPAFLSWADTNYPDYNAQMTDCSLEKQKYTNLLSSSYGKDFGVFQFALSNAQPLISGGSSVQEGITMQVSDSSVAGGGAFGTFVPYYDLPGLSDDMNNWKQGQGLSAFTFGETNSTSKNSSTTTSGGGGLSFIWEDVSGGGSGDGSTTTQISTSSLQKFQMSFASIELKQIDRGIWFDDWRSAAAIQNPEDDVTKKAQPAFNKYFGTEKAPGPAAVLNDQAIVAYQPTIEISFSSTDEASKQKSTSAGAQVCFLFICLGGQGSSNSSSITTSADGQTLKYTDSGENAYILGFVQRSFWMSADEIQSSVL